LVASEKHWHSARLLIHGKDDKVEAVIVVHEPPIPQPCHPGCFPAGTLVHTPQGPRPIESIRAGEQVTIVGADGQSTAGKVQSGLGTDNRLIGVETAGGVLLTPQTQPLCLAEGGFRPAGELKAGDRIFRWKDGKRQAVKVLAVTPTDRDEKVFNL